ncbi:MAG: hypothetical protein R3F56_24010 [Planctomycetota bacterium]
MSAPAAAQRGGGRQDEFADRYAVHMVDTKLPPIEGQTDSKERLAAIPLVQQAKKEGHLAFLYLYDSSVDAPKRETFDQIIFGNQEVGIALRCFYCARVDIAGDDDARAKFGRKLPLFVAFNDKGVWAGETSLPGYKAALRSMIGMLEKAAAGHVKPTLEAFSKTYRDTLRELRVVTGNKRMLEQRRARADDKKKAQYDKEAKELAAQEQKLLEAEKTALEKANPPPRHPEAKPFGRAERGRGR